MILGTARSGTTALCSMANAGDQWCLCERRLWNGGWENWIVNQGRDPDKGGVKHVNRGKLLRSFETIETNHILMPIRNPMAIQASMKEAIDRGRRWGKEIRDQRMMSGRCRELLEILDRAREGVVTVVKYEEWRKDHSIIEAWSEKTGVRMDGDPEYIYGARAGGRRFEIEKGRQRSDRGGEGREWKEVFEADPHVGAFMRRFGYA